MGAAVQGMGRDERVVEGAPHFYQDRGSDWSGAETYGGELTAEDIFSNDKQQETARPSRLQLRPPKKLILNVHDQIARRNAYVKNEDRRRAPIGLRAIDDAIHGGIRPGEVFGLQARSGVGKTIALCNMARRWGFIRDRLSLFYSAEMPADQLVIRMTQIVHAMSFYEAKERVESGVFDQDEVYQAELANFLLVERKRMTLEALGDAIQQAEDEYGMPVGMVAIDYLGLIGGKKNGTTYEAMSQLAIDCKDFAGEHDLALVLAVQVSREKGGDGSLRIGMGAARDSGVIEEACDYLMSLWRSGDNLIGNLAKNRHGPTIDEFPIRFNRSTLELTD